MVLGPGEFENSIPVRDPKLLFLGDVFAAPEFLPLRNVYSIGDVLLTLGGAVTLHRLCASRLGRLGHRAQPVQRGADQS